VAGGTSSLLRHAGVWMGLAATTLALCAPALGASPAPEPTPEAKALPKPDPAPSPSRSPSTRTSARDAVAPRVVATRVVRAPTFAPRRPARVNKAAAKPAAPVKRSAVRKHRGAPPAAKATLVVSERQPPRNPPLTFVSAPVLFPDEPRPTALVLAAIAVLALFSASASHLGLLYTVWRRAS
jgi:hypothetical protein